MSFRKFSIIALYIIVLFFIFLPFIVDPTRVKNEFNLIIIIGFVIFAFISQFPGNEKKKQSIQNPNNPISLAFFIIIIFFFIYRPYIEFCEPMMKLVPSIAFLMTVNYFLFVIWQRLHASSYTINRNNFFIIILIFAVGYNIFWFINNLGSFIVLIEQSIACF